MKSVLSIVWICLGMGFWMYMYVFTLISSLPILAKVFEGKMKTKKAIKNVASYLIIFQGLSTSLAETIVKPISSLEFGTSPIRVEEIIEDQSTPTPKKTVEPTVPPATATPSLSESYGYQVYIDHKPEGTPVIGFETQKAAQDAANQVVKPIAGGKYTTNIYRKP